MKGLIWEAKRAAMSLPLREGRLNLRKEEEKRGTGPLGDSSLSLHTHDISSPFLFGDVFLFFCFFWWGWWGGPPLRRHI